MHMKNLTKMSLLTIALAFSTILGCENLDLAFPTLAPDEILVEGDTVKITVNARLEEEREKHIMGRSTRTVEEKVIPYRSPKLPSKPSKKADLSTLKKDKPEDLRMIAIGGGITAGFRDFGYFNEGMITSYANLVARQMGLKKFELPLFDASEYNGIGRQVPTDFNPSGGPLQKFAMAKNNSAFNGVVGNEPLRMELKPYRGNPDNLAYPYSCRCSLRNYEINHGFFNRISSEDKFLLEKIKKKDFDFFILETGFDDFISFLTSTNQGMLNTKIHLLKDPDNHLYFADSPNPEDFLLNNFLLNKTEKGIIFNVPDVLDLPFLIDGASVFLNPEYTSGSSALRPTNQFVYLLPTSQIDSLLSKKVHYALKPGFNRDMPLEPRSIISKDKLYYYYRNYLPEFNEAIQIYSEKHNLPVVDIAGLYKKICKGGGLSTSDIGLVTAKEFFSYDQIYPSALGQAIIANEVIKTINAFYKTDIPLINLREIKE